MSPITRTLCVAVMVAGLSALITAQTTPSTYRMTLANGHVSTAADGKLVMTFESKGDLRGLVTFTVDASGSDITGGQWAFVVRYVDYLDHDGIAISDGEEESIHAESDLHAERPLFVDKGTLSGTIRGGMLTRAADGTITGVEALLLAVTGGSLTFENAAGDGSGAATDLQDPSTSSGSLGLTF